MSLHVNEFTFNHVISLLEGKKKGLGMMQHGALLNKIKNIDKPVICDIQSRHLLPTLLISNYENSCNAS